MPYLYFSQSLRQILPRVELRKLDNSPGAYPTKARTGDRTRTGRNKIFFDDGRTIVFNTGVNVSYPTTFQYDGARVGSDLTGTLGNVVGNVEKFAIDQFILPHEHTERLGPFVEEGRLDQDENGVVNSAFMTGAAYSLAPDRFKSKLSDKTVIQMQWPLTRTSIFTSGSDLRYFSPTSGAFVFKAREYTYANYGGGYFPMQVYAPLPFTPYGFHYLPGVNPVDTGAYYNSVLQSTNYAQEAIKKLPTFTGDGSEYVQTASLMNPVHAASRAQQIYLSSSLAHPFLLEKIVIEMPFAAGPGWLNDRLRHALFYNNDLDIGSDSGGPMITVGLMRQDGTGDGLRDLIASATITTAFDMSQSYTVTVAGRTSPTISDTMVVPNGVGSMLVNPTVIITGSAGISGSNNYYTGTIKFTLEPSITSHVVRVGLSGSCNNFWGYPSRSFNTRAYAASMGPIARRSSRFIEAGRNVLGSQFALMDPDDLNGTTNPVYGFNTEYENLTSSIPAGYPKYAGLKVYNDVKSRTVSSPYLLFPEDRLVLCLSKHRPCASTATGYAEAGYTEDTMTFDTVHDVSIPQGNIRITMYGDLIKEDTEFHDTLNQRLDTAAVWETIGEEPVLDQFDVTYASELSGTYIDRFSVDRALSSINFNTLTRSIETLQLYSNFGPGAADSAYISSQYLWSKSARLSTLKKSCKNVNVYSTTERFWDCRVNDPFETINFVNPNYRLEGSDAYAPYSINYILYSGVSASYAGFTPDRGLRDWFMTYPYEGKYDNLSKVFVDSIASARRLWRFRAAGGGGVSTAFFTRLYYSQLNFILGDDTATQYLVIEPNGGTSSGVTFPEFVKIFYGIGDGRSKTDNQHVTFRSSSDGGVSYQGARIRGWRYGMLNAFPVTPGAVFRRDRFGQLRDMLEQRLDAKFYQSSENSENGILSVAGVKEGPVQVRFYDRYGNKTEPTLTLSSNLSYEATSSLPYSDGVARNRGSIDYTTLNISNVTV